MKKKDKPLILVIILIIVFEQKLLIKDINERIKIKELSDKHLTLMILLNQWLKLTQQGKNIITYFHKNNIKKIAIYGMSYIGERLYDELIQSDIEIKYVFDKNSKKRYGSMKVVHSYDEMQGIDAVVITPVFYYDDIKEELEGKIKGKIISMQDILYELQNYK